MPEPTTWRAAVRPTSPGWIRVPSGLDGQHTESWAEETLADLHRQWGDQWRPQDDQESLHLLRRAAQDRGRDKVLDLLYWPFARPVLVRTNVRIHPSIPLTSWLEEGFEIDGFDHAAMGPAVRCIAQADTEVLGEQKQLITAHFVFDDGDLQVQVEVEPTFIELYSHVSFEVVNLVAGLDVRRGDGEPFVPRPAAGYTQAPIDTFTATDDA